MRRFRLLNLVDLKLGLEDLLTKRKAALMSVNVGKGYEAMLTQKQAEVQALPALAGGRPLAEELSIVDGEHDGFGGAIFFITEAYLRVPNLDPKTKTAILRVRASLVPALDDLRDSYADEAEAAIRRKQELPDLEADLKRIPIAGNTTLYDWALGYLGAGEKLHTLLSERADSISGGRSKAQRLRSAIIGLLNRARSATADEIASNEALGENLDAQIFGYLDELEANRKNAQRSSKANESKGEL